MLYKPSQHYLFQPPPSPGKAVSNQVTHLVSLSSPFGFARRSSEVWLRGNHLQRHFEQHFAELLRLMSGYRSACPGSWLTAGLGWLGGGSLLGSGEAM